ncbi:tetratricopeptide repeat protein [Treponema zuelzerae]|uniref:Tetratricopeptide repeat protein n=1 Tax=Teretinema zuelzerae TaxID=156 RepID=A0AAE3EGM6_9SPIR|nr:tetratricopeptide repeat protein [Teretinema zuelzerae]MCD1654166.1 tetratricopeptide repeat protein [Teretinema zuelzerae]
MEETSAWLNDNAVQLAAEGLHEEAIASLRKGLLSDSHNPVLWFNLALSCRAIGRLPEAREALLHAAEENPLDVDTLDTLGVVLHETGEDSAAEECYQNALELSPGNGRVWNNYGVLQFSQSRFEEAAQSFEKAVTLIPDFDDALYNLRDTYEELGRSDDMNTCARILEQRGFIPD